MVLLDTDFASSFFKIGKLKFILTALKIQYLTMPSTVHEELKNALFFDRISPHFAFREKEVDDIKFILIREVNLNEMKEFLKEEKVSFLGQGELGCFLLAKKNNDKILIDDSHARKAAEEQGLKVVSIPAFLSYCKNNNILSNQDIKSIIKDLKEKDYYRFNQEVESKLIE